MEDSLWMVVVDADCRVDNVFKDMEEQEPLIDLVIDICLSNSPARTH